ADPSVSADGGLHDHRGCGVRAPQARHGCRALSGVGARASLMSVPYGLMADLHCAGWSAFASLDEQGRNSRLMEIIHEIKRCSEAVRDAGGNTVVIAGDVFHHRGQVTPSVYNPLASALSDQDGAAYEIIPGNHDLESRDCKALTSAVKMLGDLHNVQTYHSPVWFQHDG